ncbi:MAG: iron ABC transporter permease, partial [Erysipelotrichaceae bacterium]|nr:iron ABC transporter permease [Erysipelotrichaceae bacterium]
MKQKKQRRGFEIWTVFTWVIIALFLVFFIYPLANLLRQAFFDANGFTMKNFIKFFSKAYYTNTIKNSFKVSILTTRCALLVGIPYSYFYSFYNIKGRKLLIIISVMCCMSAPFVGAYSWTLLLGRAGVITQALAKIGINIPTIYGMGGIILVQVSKFYPLVLIYMNG